MSLAHWMYLLGALIIVIAMIARKNIVLLSMVFTILVAWANQGSIVKAVQALFNANLYAATQLFNIFLIIAIMVAMLKSASSIHADRLMVKPIQKLMVTPVIAYIVLVIATFLISLFFWPTPAIPLVGTLLIPAAVRAGLSPMTSAIAVALAGQGMALAGDLVLQAAPKITATAAGIPMTDVLYKGGILTTITGVIAITLAYLFQRQEDRKFAEGSLEERHRLASVLAGSTETAATLELGRDLGRRKAAAIAVLIPVLLILVIVVMLTEGLKGGDATALLGGAGALLLMVISLTKGGRNWQPWRR
ncbi:hypothetical protein [Kyrpidia spormannii]|uniref:hypothetical protein n=1 Tax=Kyrpidia spormannii TaxID=2055160 RepID=UPI0018D74863|nr:hypothetical protein [Kyrpidia spormannii]